MEKKISIVIPVWNQIGYTRICMDYLLKNTDGNFELVIVDNGSTDGTEDFFKDLKGSVDLVYIKNPRNFGSIIALNQGIAKSASEIVCTMHNDLIIFEKGWQHKVASLIESNANVGLVGFAGRRTIDKRGVVDEKSLVHNMVNEDLNQRMREPSREVAVLDGVFVAARKKVFQEIGCFDEVYGIMHFYDVDISLKSLKAGYKNFICAVEALHIYNGGVTRKTKAYKELVKNDTALLDKNARIFHEKWKNFLPVSK